MKALVVILVLALVAALVVIVRQRRVISKSRSKSMSLKASFGRALALIQSIPTVLGSGLAAIAAIRAGYDAEIAKLQEQVKAAGADSDIDLSGLEAASAAAEAAEAEFGKAIAVNTPAAEEVHTSEGGTGTVSAESGGTVVDPATIDTAPVVAAVTEPAPEAEAAGD